MIIFFSQQTSSRTQLSFLIAPNNETLQHLVWAIATVRPSSGAVDATLTQHIASGGITLDLSQEFTATEIPGSVPTSPPGGTSYQPPSATQTGYGNDLPAFELPPLLPYQKMLMAYAVLCGVGFLIVLPAGALIARWARTYTASWFKIHWMIQAGLGIPIIASGWALSVAGVHKKQGIHFNDTHKVAGLVIFGAYTLQLLLGVHIHIFKPKTKVPPRTIPLSAVTGPKAGHAFTQLLLSSTRPIPNYVHAILGISIIGFSFWNVCSRILRGSRADCVNRYTWVSQWSGKSQPGAVKLPHLSNVFGWHG